MQMVQLWCRQLAQCSPKRAHTCCYCPMLLQWVSGHRYHHLHTDTPLDPHSPYEGFWWSHMGWLLDNDVSAAYS